MSEIPDGLRYTEEHEYLTATDESGVYQIGITDYAQGELGDVVYVELPTVGESFEKKATPCASTRCATVAATVPQSARPMPS